MAARQNQSQIFFSYNHSSRAIVESIHERLKQKFRIWIDYDRLRAGDEAWKKEVTKGLLESEIVICFITKIYSGSKNCLDELEFSIQEKKKILCVLLEDLNQYGDDIDVKHVKFCIVRRNFLYAYKKDRTFNPWSELLFEELLATIYSLGGPTLM